MTEPAELPGSPGAVRLVFAVDGDDVGLVSRQAVDVVVPPSDPVSGYEGEEGFWVETRAADETTLHRRVLPDPFRRDMEVFTDDPDRSITRTPVTRRQGVFTVLVPADEEADHVALLSSGTAAAQARSGAAAAAGALEVARFALRGEDR